MTRDFNQLTLRISTVATRARETVQCREPTAVGPQPKCCSFARIAATIGRPVQGTIACFDQAAHWFRAVTVAADKHMEDAVFTRGRIQLEHGTQVCSPTLVGCSVQYSIDPLRQAATGLCPVRVPALAGAISSVNSPRANSPALMASASNASTATAAECSFK